jgi:hypothetical protein
MKFEPSIRQNSIGFFVIEKNEFLMVNTDLLHSGKREKRYTLSVILNKENTQQMFGNVSQSEKNRLNSTKSILIYVSFKYLSFPSVGTFSRKIITFSF